MKHGLRAGLAITFLTVLLTGVSTVGTRGVSAAGELPPGPDRFSVMTVDYTSYQWWLVGWDESAAACQIFIDHDGLPTGSEIYNGCGQDLYNQWVQTEPCDTSEVDPSSCQGDYLEYINSAPAQRKIGVALPPAVVWVTLGGCTAENSSYLCSSQPILVLTGEEPLPNEHITTLGGMMDGKAFTCDPVCRIDLAATDQDGMALQFWAYSSYGDSSQVFDAQVRVVGGKDQDALLWYVDVISTQWRGAPLASCSQTWEAFPPVGGLPAWLSTPKDPGKLTSDIPYEYLATNLISQGVADASACPDGGLGPDGNASQCGMEAAQPAVKDWQNRFDDRIYAAAVDSGIPAQLLKNIFSHESQFWPGVFTGRSEVGLGHLTENGADTALLWNQSFFDQYCPLVLSDQVCQNGYPQLKPEEQALLRGALVHSVDASCADCPQGLDLTQAEFSVSVFAETLAANCEQTGMIVHNASGRTPGEVSSFEDLWRFTLVNYNAGPGCLILAVKAAEGLGEPLDWEHVASHLTPVCQPAQDYVADLSR